MNRVKKIWLIKAALLVLLAMAILSLFFTGYRVHRHLAGVSTRIPQTGSTVLATENEEHPIQPDTILRANLFGVDEHASIRQGQSASQPNAADGISTSGLRLIGTVAGNASLARAIIQNSEDKSVKIHRIGDTVGGASLIEIREHEIVLIKGVIRKTLHRSSGQATPPAISKPRLTASIRPKTTPIPLPPPPTGPDTVVEDLMTKTTIQPEPADSATPGLKITDLENVPLAKKLGLRDGDVIRGVNGQQVTTRQKAFQVMRKAKSQKRLTIELIRDGQEKTLSFP